MNANIWTYVPTIVALGLAALAALRLALTRHSPAERANRRAAAARTLAWATVLQGVHFAEEAATGLHESLGTLLGSAPIPFGAFVVFNGVWLAIWLISIPGLSSGRRDALFAAWFLAIAGVINGIAHPLLAIRSGGYFPGLMTSTLVGAGCLWLGHRLVRATVRQD